MIVCHRISKAVLVWATSLSLSLSLFRLKYFLTHFALSIGVPKGSCPNKHRSDFHSPPYPKGVNVMILQKATRGPGCTLGGSHPGPPGGCRVCLGRLLLMRFHIVTAMKHFHPDSHRHPRDAVVKLNPNEFHSAVEWEVWCAHVLNCWFLICNQSMVCGAWVECVFLNRALGLVSHILPSLKLTASLPLTMDGWKTFSFPIGARPIFRGVCC